MKTMKEVFNGKPCGFSTRMTDEQVRHGQHAINCHDELVNALDEMAKLYRETYGLDGGFDPEITIAESALKKARGEK